MTAHTPGPWTAEYDGDDADGCATPDGAYYVAASCDGGMLAEVFGPDRSDDDNEANARLIAAAPELLAACEAMLLRIGDPGEDGPLQTAMLLARAAIAKARGV